MADVQCVLLAMSHLVWDSTGLASNGSQHNPATQSGTNRLQYDKRGSVYNSQHVAEHSTRTARLAEQYANTRFATAASFAIVVASGPA